MCGIVGYFGLSLPEEERPALLQRMCDTIIHRGPDDDGYYTDASVGLGMRRLSIIDVAHGHQPIHSPDEKKHIVFNGEIYNYQELRNQQQNANYPLVTNSDTEVLLAQYELDGEKCLHKLNGMFAIAIWDELRGRLFLARDRMGVKPLYYYWDGIHFLFASEIKALLVSGYVAKQLNLQAVWDYLTFRYVPQPEAIWENVYKLLPGHFLTLSLQNPQPHIERYWDIPYSDTASQRRFEDYCDEFSDLLSDSVRLRLIADVPVGILLSGGIDSSAIAAVIAEHHNLKLNSFSVAFKDSPTINEMPFAREVARQVGTNHHEIVIGEKEFCDFLPDMVQYTDEPLADLASVPLYYVSRLAREYVKVVLSGEGSDEILGGYDLDNNVRDWDRRKQILQKFPHWLRWDSGFSALGKILRKLNLINSISLEPQDMRLWKAPMNMTNHRTQSEKQRLFNLPTHFQDSLDCIRSEVLKVESKDPLHQVLYVFCQSWLVEDLLMKADRMSMANSLELRTPFLDYRLVEWAARAPSWVKISKNDKGKYETKRVLRQFAQGRLPENIINRPKMGFPVPLYDWTTNRLKSWAYDLLARPDAYIFNWLKPVPVRQLLDRATEPTSNLMDRHNLWDLLILEQWCQVWLKI